MSLYVYENAVTIEATTFFQMLLNKKQMIAIFLVSVASADSMVTLNVRDYKQVVLYF